MVARLVWSAVLVLVLLLIVVAGMVIAAFPLWPPALAVLLASYWLRRLPVARR